MHARPYEIKTYLTFVKNLFSPDKNLFYAKGNLIKTGLTSVSRAKTCSPRTKGLRIRHHRNDEKSKDNKVFLEEISSVMAEIGDAATNPVFNQRITIPNDCDSRLSLLHVCSFTFLNDIPRSSVKRHLKF